MPERDSRLDKLRQSMPPPLARKVLQREQIEGERKRVTVLFSDVVNSTGLAEGLDPEQWAEIINGLHRLIAGQVYRFEGTVAQLLGDGVLCFFGAPISHEDDAERAVRAGLAIVDAAREYSDQVREEYGLPGLELRIGINTGPVVVGKMGSGQHVEYLAVGDTVNLASRMQSEAAANSVLISGHTQRLVEPLFELVDRGEIALRGRAAPVRGYEVIRENPGAGKRRGLAGVAPSLFGRMREISALRGVSDSLKSGQGGVVCILGESGIGKTRLVAEWKRAARQVDESGIELVWAEGRCLSYGLGLPYHLVGDLGRAMLGISPMLAPRELNRVLADALLALFSEKSLSQELLPYLQYIFGLEVTAGRLDGISAPELLAQCADAVGRTFREIASLRPTVIVCEDMQWADAASVELLARLLPLTAELPLLLCLVSRPERSAPAWKLIQEARETPGLSPVELHLTPLSPRDSETLVTSLVGANSLPAPLLNLVLSHAEGNPFFMEEVVAMLTDHGVIRRTGGQVALEAATATIEIPETVQGVLRARIDQLSQEVRNTLYVASVIGREFPLEVLLTVMEKL